MRRDRYAPSACGTSAVAQGAGERQSSDARADDQDPRPHDLPPSRARSRARSGGASPASRFVDQLLTYFDQYALSSQIWSPDSTSILLPETDADGSTHVAVRFVDGRPPIAIPGDIAFWSPS